MTRKASPPLPETVSVRTEGLERELRRWRRQHPFAPWSVLLRQAVQRQMAVTGAREPQPEPQAEVTP